MKKTCGILLNNRDYFIPYVNWLQEAQKFLDFDISGIHAKNSDWTFGEKLMSFDELIGVSDVVISLGYWKIIKQEDINKVPYGIVNFHHSYRLKFRGRHTATWALRHGESVHGSTMHFIDSSLDSGRIIDTDFFEISDGDDAESVFLKSNSIGLSLLKRNFKNVISGNIVDYKKHSDEYYVYKQKDLSHQIDSSFITNESEFIRQIKSLTFSDHPLPYVVVDGKTVFLKIEREGK
jgi:methionyl-tRNA formyltransferase